MAGSGKGRTVWIIYGTMMDFASNDGGFATTATILGMCMLVVVVMTAGLYGWGRWF
jgi:hypothetical protein